MEDEKLLTNNNSNYDGTDKKDVRSVESEKNEEATAYDKYESLLNIFRPKKHFFIEKCEEACRRHDFNGQVNIPIHDWIIPAELNSAYKISEEIYHNAHNVKHPDIMFADKGTVPNPILILDSTSHGARFQSVIVDLNNIQRL